MKTVYGPVSSWRLGRSLGVDLICSEGKICSFDCIYCQLGEPLKITADRSRHVTIREMKSELGKALEETSPDVITFSGMGEPTLAYNMDTAVGAIRKMTDLPLAVLTNSSLMSLGEVRGTLSKLDIVVAKLDAHNEKTFQRINQPADNITFKDTVYGIKRFKNTFTGKLALQIMFIQDNISYVNEMINLARDIKPDEVQINTPLRASPIQPLSRRQVCDIEERFNDEGLNTISVYSSKKPRTRPLDKEELIKRRRTEA
jgi:wyosine [tRNA(Phe)-imidazoG37] synthetase (radical SAM superfamily)